MSKPGCKACKYSTRGHCVNHPPTEEEKQQETFDQLVEDMDPEYCEVCRCTECVCIPELDEL